VSAVHGRGTSSATSPPGGRRSMAAGRVLVALLVCFAVAALLSAASLRRHAEDLSPSLKRDLALVAARPLAAVSSALALDRPGHLVQDALGRSGAGGRAELRPLAGTRLPSSGGGTTSAGPRRISKKDPLILYIAGDSMAGVFGPQLAHMSEKTGLVRPYVDFHLDTGLVRPDYFDWPLRLQTMMKQVRPDAVVVLFGANDNQDIRTNTRFVPFGSADWRSLYRQRVDQVMTLLAMDGRRVFWVGQPIMQPAKLAGQIRLMDDIYHQEAAGHPSVTYVDSWSLFATPDGRYSAYLRDGAGDLRLMRLPDGVHLTGFGADRLSYQVLRTIAAVFRFRTGHI
jgi:lysophospholipase L1-like esterase